MATGEAGEVAVLWEGRVPGGEGPNGWWTDERRVMSDGTVMYYFPLVPTPRWSHMRPVQWDDCCTTRAHMATALAAAEARATTAEQALAEAVTMLSEVLSAISPIALCGYTYTPEVAERIRLWLQARARLAAGRGADGEGVKGG
jgi:hypothetical protein